MTGRTRVYVAGPYTIPDPETNTQRAIDAATKLLDAGYAPYLPHLTHYWHLRHARPYETWLSLDNEWVTACEALVRLPGESSGADKEVKLAEHLGIPVYLGIEDFLANPPMLGDRRFHNLLQRIGRLHDQKQADYGRAGDAFANIRASQEWGVPAWIGSMIRLCDKVRRLQALAQRGFLRNEPALDSMLDIAVYALIAYILYVEEQDAPDPPS